MILRTERAAETEADAAMRAWLGARNEVEAGPQGR
jgi:hypothetical protein